MQRRCLTAASSMSCCMRFPTCDSQCHPPTVAAPCIRTFNDAKVNQSAAVTKYTSLLGFVPAIEARHAHIDL